ATALDVVDAAEGRVHRTPEGRADPDPTDDRRNPDRGGAGADPVDRILQGPLLDVGEEPLDVLDHAVLDVRAVHDLAEDEEDEQGEGEDGEHQVVGDHPGETGDVLLVGPVPECPRPGVPPELPARVCGRGWDLHQTGRASPAAAA